MVWFTAIGLVLMLAGGESLVRGAVGLARRLGVSPMVIGVTLVGFGTSAPELATCIDAVLRDAPGIAVGNVVGSNIANVLLILATAALLHPIVCRPRELKRDGGVLLVSGIICAAVILIGRAERWLGAVFLLILIGYLIAAALDDRRQNNGDAKEDAETGPRPLPLDLALLAFGIGGVIFGADLLVTGAVDLARWLNVSETTIGLSVVAIGTSLPELATAVIASLKRESDLAFGNVIGSNIFNVFGILGAAALTRPFTIPADLADVDLWVMLAATLALLVFAATGLRISRREGVVLLAGYVAYLGFLSGTLAF